MFYSHLNFSHPIPSLPALVPTLNPSPWHDSEVVNPGALGFGSIARLASPQKAEEPLALLY